MTPQKTQFRIGYPPGRGEVGPRLRAEADPDIAAGLQVSPSPSRLFAQLNVSRCISTYNRTDNQTYVDRARTGHCVLSAGQSERNGNGPGFEGRAGAQGDRRDGAWSKGSRIDSAIAAPAAGGCSTMLAPADSTWRRVGSTVPGRSGVPSRTSSSPCKSLGRRHSPSMLGRSVPGSWAGVSESEGGWRLPQGSSRFISVRWECSVKGWCFQRRESHMVLYPTQWPSGGALGSVVATSPARTGGRPRRETRGPRSVHIVFCLLAVISK